MEKRIAIINIGVGNINSVFNAIKRLDEKPRLISLGNELDLFNPTHIIMPGVGAVGPAINNLRLKNFINPLNNLVKKKGVYFCGICLGMQIIAETCEEFGIHEGLGWIPGKVQLLDTKGLSSPHMGWNTIKVTNKNNIFLEINDLDMFFAHSYYMNCPEKYIVATSKYGSEFAAIVQSNNIIGIQSHPEKSSLAGNIFLNKFINLG